MARPHLPSLDLILDEVRSERHAQLVHFEALDAKAGVVLGFAAFTKLNLVDATVAEAAQVRTVLILKARMLKVAMVMLALAVVSVALAVT